MLFGHRSSMGIFGRAFVGVGLSPQVMVAEHVTVVGEHDNQRVIIHAAFFKGGEDSPDLLIDEGNRSVIGPA
jgi:hypothetical protein